MDSHKFTYELAGYSAESRRRVFPGHRQTDEKTFRRPRNKIIPALNLQPNSPPPPPLPAYLSLKLIFIQIRRRNDRNYCDSNNPLILKSWLFFYVNFAFPSVIFVAVVFKSLGNLILFVYIRRHFYRIYSCLNIVVKRCKRQRLCCFSKCCRIYIQRETRVNVTIT